ncbi:hypothetical protein J2128_002555 [Methanomicrobium sp. W14]|uniref:hypothetical protein n=1 Tax=Methanomicrobium sp. W14 TaxID=2817839 RepID=UPI001AE89689|nr:hypothetical protein [Methanomicrobium sp. W14]MBP2134584.1 hypothetical protein [Methanomicrobium sp. W14]
MGAEVYQAQVIKNFFETITGTDRNLTRIYMCVVSLAKLRMESPEKITHLMDQMRKSKQKRELSIDIIDYVCTCAIEMDMQSVSTAFGVTEIAGMADSFNSISLDSL